MISVNFSTEDSCANGAVDVFSLWEKRVFGRTLAKKFRLLKGPHTGKGTQRDEKDFELISIKHLGGSSSLRE